MILVFIVDPEVGHQIVVPSKHLVTQCTLVGALSTVLLQ